jgi:lipid-A-disaccharide synthase
MASLLVSAGEQSGDRAAAAVLRHLPRDVRAFGLGGDACAHAGMTLDAHLRDLTALGTQELATRMPNIARARSTLKARVKEERPRAALLVNYTGFNASLLRFLGEMGVEVLWYGAPQIWAWGEFRGKRLATSIDKMAVMLPFEEKLWRDLGADARYVGHPAREVTMVPQPVLRDALGTGPRARAVAILPGSRSHEARALLPAMLDGYERVRRQVASLDARILLAPSLDAETTAWARAVAAEARVPIVSAAADAGAALLLSAFDVALCASGTASLEAALARAVPIVLYRVSLLTEALARAVLKTPNIALPNVLLGRRAFKELVQRDVKGETIAAELTQVLEDYDQFLHACDEVERTLGSYTEPSRLVAEMLEPWLSANLPVRKKSGSRTRRTAKSAP